MGWARANLHWLLFVAFLLSTAATVGVGVIATLSFLAALFAPGGPLLAALFESLIPYVLPLLLLGTLDVVFLLGAIGVAIRRFSFRKLVPSMPNIQYRSERRWRWAREMERRLPFLRPLALPELLEPTPEQRREQLKEQYVEGEITVEEFEQRMYHLVDGEPTVPDPGSPEVGSPDADASDPPRREERDRSPTPDRDGESGEAEAGGDDEDATPTDDEEERDDGAKDLEIR